MRVLPSRGTRAGLVASRGRRPACGQAASGFKWSARRPPDSRHVRSFPRATVQWDVAERRLMLFSRGARSARMPSSSCGGAPCVEVVVREVWRRALAGQPAPPPPVVLGLAVVAAVLVLLLVQIRNWFGFCSVLVTGTVLLAASWWLPDRGQSVLAYLVTWFLLMAAPRPVLELAAQRRRRGARGTPDSDADQLARLTGVPAAVWIALFLSVTVGALLLGGHRLTLG